MRRLTFILGGARSGKSEYAESLAGAAGGSVLFVATAQGIDEEMRERIAAHRQHRPARWQTLELPTGVGRLLLDQKPEASIVVLDCLTLLVSNVLLEAAPNVNEPDGQATKAAVEAEFRILLEAIEDSKADWVVVSNEVGQGIVPAYPAGRLFRDLLGWANKELARRADEVIWMVAGIPVPIRQHRA